MSMKGKSMSHLKISLNTFMRPTILLNRKSVLLSQHTSWLSACQTDWLAGWGLIQSLTSICYYTSNRYYCIVRLIICMFPFHNRLHIVLYFSQTSAALLWIQRAWCSLGLKKCTSDLSSQIKPCTKDWVDITQQRENNYLK